MNHNSSSNDDLLIETLKSCDWCRKRFDISSIQVQRSGAHHVIFSVFHLLWKRNVAIKMGKTDKDNVSLIKDLVKIKSLDRSNSLKVLEHYAIQNEKQFFLVLVMDQVLISLEDCFDSSGEKDGQLLPFKYLIDLLPSSDWCKKRFEISTIKILGSGAHGAVFSVFHLKYNRRVVIKIGRQKEDNVSLFNELVKMKSLNHPNIVQVLEYKTIHHENHFFLVLVMEQGLMSLETYLRKNSAGLKEKELCILMTSLSSAISYAHGNKITHNDLKTANVILFRNGESSEYCFKISDFGSAYELAEYESNIMSVKSGMDFSPAFCAPEINLINDRDEGKADFFAGDVYSLGTICINCTGISIKEIQCLSFVKIKETYEKNLFDLMCELEKKEFSKETREKIIGMMAFNSCERVLPKEPNKEVVSLEEKLNAQKQENDLLRQKLEEQLNIYEEKNAWHCEKEKELEEKIIKLEEEANRYKEKNAWHCDREKELEEKIIKLEDEVNSCKNEILECINREQQLQERENNAIQQARNSESRFQQFLFESNLVLNEDFHLLKNKFQIIKFIPRKMEYANYQKIFYDFSQALNFNSAKELISRLELIFRASEHEFSSSEFHRHCDGKGPTIILINQYFTYGGGGGKYGSSRPITTVVNNFGCFASRSWNSSGGYSEAPGSFLFRIYPSRFTKGKIYQNNENAIYGNPRFGPVMGGNFLFRGDIQIKGKVSGLVDYEVYKLC